VKIKDIVQQGVDQITLEKITFIDAIGNRIPIPMQLCHTYEVPLMVRMCAQLSLLLGQMLRDVMKLYFGHQRPPGSFFFEQDQYELVQGPDRRAITSAEWDSTVTPGGTVEMSIQVEMPYFTDGECPRCRRYSSADGWATWQEFVLHVQKLYLSYFQSRLPEALQHSTSLAFQHHK
jgi:hypothetical protein